MTRRVSPAKFAVGLLALLGCALVATGCRVRAAQPTPPQDAGRGHDRWLEARDVPGAAAQRLRAVQGILRARQQRRQARATRAVSGAITPPAPPAWHFIGPASESGDGGRVTALAVDPRNPLVVYAGGADGGVWKTTDGGKTWTPLTDDQASLSMGAIALAPSNPDIVYAGTGEPYNNFDAYGGIGVLKSTDAGATWTDLPGPLVGQGIAQIAVSPTDPNTLLVAAGGIYRSTDGGNTWAQTLSGGSATAVVFDAANPSRVYGVLGSVFGPPFDVSGFYVSDDGGVTWTASNGGGTSALPSKPWNFTAFAQAPTRPATMFLAFNNALYKSADGGASWNAMPVPAYCGQQCWFDNVLAVDPSDPQVVFVGGSADFGVDGILLRSSDGGTTWSDVHAGIHTDTHALAFSADQSLMYVGSDGGVWSSSSWATPAPTWNDLNNGLALAQFYAGIAIDPLDPTIAFGGTQDNGTLRYHGQPQWDWVNCGDGGFNAIDPLNPQVVYSSCTTGTTLGKSTDGGESFQDTAGSLPGLAARALEFTGDDILIDPTNHQRLYFIGPRTSDQKNYIYQSTDAGATWTIMSPDFSAEFGALRLAMSAPDPDTLYAALSGISSPEVAVTHNATAGAGATWSVVPVPSSGFATVDAVVADPADSKVAYALSNGLYKTTDGGATWTESDAGLPKLPVDQLVFDPDIPGTLYAALDYGVFASSDSGATWSELGTGLPNSGLVDLALYRPGRILRVATHGRGMWDLDLPAVNSPASLSATSLAFSTPVGSTSAAQTVTLTNNGPSPMLIYGSIAPNGFAASNNCSQVLAAHATCQFSVTFTPVTAGTPSGLLAINDDAPGAPQTIALSGNGSGQAGSLSPNGLTFSAQAAATSSPPQIVTFNNTGTLALTIQSIVATGDFSQTNACGPSLAVGAHCSISIVFKPTAAGARTGALTVSDGAPNSPESVPLSGTGIAGPAASIAVSAGAGQAATVGTAFNAPLVATVNDAENDPIAGATVTFTAPASGAGALWGGARTATATSNAQGQATSPALAANDISGTYSVSASAAGVATPATFALTNSAGGAAAIAAIAGTPQSAPIRTAFPIALAARVSDIFGNPVPGVNVAFQISGFGGAFTFAGSTNSSDAFALTDGQGVATAPVFTADNSISSYTVTASVPGVSAVATFQLSNTGLPAAALSPANLAFAAQLVGSASAAQTATLANAGSAPLALTSIAASGDFSQTNNCGSTLAPGATCAIQVVFKPSAAGPRSGALTVADNAAASPQSAALSGSGTAPAAALSPANLAFAAQLVGSASAAQTATLANAGSAPLALTSIAGSGDFSQTNNCGSTLAPGATCAIQVVFKPSAAGPRSGTLTVADNAAASPQSAALSGSGQGLTLAPATGSASTATATAGQAATYILVLTPSGGFAGNVALSCAAIPAASGLGCSAAPASLAFSGTATATATITATTTARSALSPIWLEWGFAGLLAILIAAPKRKLRLSATLAVAALAIACGGGGTGGTPPPVGGGLTGTPAGTYTLTVTATAANGSASAQLILVVN